MFRCVDWPVAGTRRAVEAAADAVPGHVPVHLGRGEEDAYLEVEVTRSETIAAGEDRPQQLTALDGLTRLDGERVVEVPVHRVEPTRVLHNDDQTGVLRPGEDHLARGRGIDPHTARLRLGQVPVLTRVKPARVVPRVLGGV